MADSLLRALHKRFTSSGLSGIITGGLWTSEVPEGQEPPYAVLEDLGTAYEHTSQPDARKWLEHSRVVFHVWGRGAEEAEDCAESLLDAFAGGGGILEFAGGTKRCQAVLPHSLTVQSEMVRYRDGTLIYRASVGFDIRISKG